MTDYKNLTKYALVDIALDMKIIASRNAGKQIHKNDLLVLIEEKAGKLNHEGIKQIPMDQNTVETPGEKPVGQPIAPAPTPPLDEPPLQERETLPELTEYEKNADPELPSEPKVETNVPGVVPGSYRDGTAFDGTDPEIGGGKYGVQVIPGRDAEPVRSNVEKNYAKSINTLSLSGTLSDTPKREKRFPHGAKSSGEVYQINKLKKARNKRKHRMDLMRRGHGWANGLNQLAIQGFKWKRGIPAPAKSNNPVSR